MLAAMGIQVWYPRVAGDNAKNATNAPDSVPFVSSARDSGASEDAASDNEAVQSSPEVNQDLALKPAAAASQSEDSLALATEVQVAAEIGVVPIEYFWWRGDSGMLLLSPSGNYDERLLRDIVIAMDWRARGAVGQIDNGHFRWPQLTSTSGTPDRAIAAFIDKFAPADCKWVMVTDKLLAELAPYLTFSIDIDVLPEALHQADEKKRLWQILGK